MYVWEIISAETLHKNDISLDAAMPAYAASCRIAHPMLQKHNTTVRIAAELGPLSMIVCGLSAWYA
jgi:hypothetical protein